ncbi:MAG TPA: hypothetical protein EYN70_01065 [Planctomycetaceae bacterium]|nr:hypothetical protein [Planctomycetaceae bacterium]
MNAWEILLFVLFFLAACTPFVLQATSRKQLVWAVGGLLGLMLLAMLLSSTRNRTDPTVNIGAIVPQQVNDGDFVSSRTCLSCHPQQHASWHKTYHRTMTQLGLPEAIVPTKDFEQKLQLTSGAVTFTLQRQGDEFWVNTPDPDEEYRLLKLYELVSTTPELYQTLAFPYPVWPAPLTSPAYLDIFVFYLREEIDPRKPASVPPHVDRQVVLVTGSHSMQIFWLPSEQDGHPLRLFPWIYQIRAQRWMPYEDSFVVHPYFGRPPASWNDNCIACHTVNGDFTYLNGPSNPQIKSTVAEYGISCEACHGPGKDHVRKHQNPLTRYQQHIAPARDHTIVNPAKLTPVMGSQICGQCHSSFHQYKPYRAGDNVNEARAFVRHGDAQDQNSPFYDNFWKDGSIRIGGREYLGLIESPCYLRGKMSCMTCHSMHQSDPNDQLAQHMDSNQACLQCHKDMTNRITEHTYHPATSEGSRCYNCHMPHTAYALLGAIRNHRISSPSVTNHLQSGHPNACNLCHLDKTLEWTSEHLTQWYGQPAVELDSNQQNVAAAVQMLLSGDAVQRIVIAWHMGWEPAWEASGKNWQMPILAHVLQDPYSAVRFVAHKSMQKLPHYEQWQGTTDYDFLALKEEWQQFQNGFLQRWQAAETKPPENPTSVLWNSDGTLQLDKLLELLKQQDKSKIMLAE